MKNTNFKPHNIILIEQNLVKEFSKIKYTKRFMYFKIHQSWWSNRNNIQLSYRRFLQLSWIMKKLPNSLLMEENFSEKLEIFLILCDSNEKITKFIKKTKYIMKVIFEEKQLKKTTFLENILDDRIDISRRTITRVLNEEEYLEFSLKTFLIILEGLKIQYDDFFKKIIEVMIDETNN